MAPRKRLANRRGHELVDFTHGGFAITGGVGHFDDGTIAEVFLNAAKTGTAVEAAARDAAITASLYFQHGGSPETLRRALTRNADGSPSGPLGRLLDLLADGDGAGEPQVEDGTPLIGRLARALAIPAFIVATDVPPPPEDAA